MSRCPMVSRINALQFFFGSIQGDPAKRKKKYLGTVAAEPVQVGRAHGEN